MAILRKSSAVSRSSGHSSHANHADVLRDNPNNAFNKSIQEIGVITPSGSRRNSEKKTPVKSPRKKRPSNTSSLSLFPTDSKVPLEPEHLSRPAAHTHSYTRPTGPEIVAPHLPSCPPLPHDWSAVHDRFIAYLATHAPLTKDGLIPPAEELRERWRTVEIVRLLGERFVELEGVKIRHSAIENRLLLLDQAGDNDYFKIPYGGYIFEEWGRGL